MARISFTLHRVFAIRQDDFAAVHESFRRQDDFVLLGLLGCMRSVMISTALLDTDRTADYCSMLSTEHYFTVLSSTEWYWTMLNNTKQYWAQRTDNEQ